MNYVLIFVFAVLVAALVLSFARLVMGPTLPDRVVALDLITAIMVGLIGTHSILTGIPGFLDVAIVIALMAFLATIGFARFLGQGGVHDG